MTDTMTPTAAPSRPRLDRERGGEFRQKCVDFMETHAKRNGVPTIEEQKAYLAAAAEAGLAGVPFPAEYGGGGLTLAHEKIWREVKSNYTMMDGEFIISHGMCLPMLNEWGTPEQKQQFLADNMSGRTMWCQMFSEPGAGSDVASLQSKAELDGDEWVLNGQKVWTTLAHKSDYGIVVARTDPDQVKHAGLSMFIMDMKAPGVEIRPDPPDRRRIALQRGVLHRRAHPEGLADRRTQLGLEAGHVDADVRARRHRWRGRRQDQPAELQAAA